MTGDKLKRVRAIRKWLEKAEQSYMSHKEISGELNLIMAQAEMQRLKETDQSAEKRRSWGIRLASAAAAAGIVFGAFFFTGPVQHRTEPPASKESVSLPSPAIRGRESQPDLPKTEISTDMPILDAGKAEKEVSAQPQPAPAPVLSEKEIQSVVGEAGRALRGKS